MVTKMLTGKGVHTIRYHTNNDKEGKTLKMTFTLNLSGHSQ